MTRKTKHLATALLLVVVYGPPAQEQMAAPSILHIDVENFVEYQGDVSDYQKWQPIPK